jgi:hypothetical protein
MISAVGRGRWKQLLVVRNALAKVAEVCLECDGGGDWTRCCGLAGCCGKRTLPRLTVQHCSLNARFEAALLL